MGSGKGNCSCRVLDRAKRYAIRGRRAKRLGQNHHPSGQEAGRGRGGARPSPSESRPGFPASRRRPPHFQQTPALLRPWWVPPGVSIPHLISRPKCELRVDTWQPGPDHVPQAPRRPLWRLSIPAAETVHQRGCLSPAQEAATLSLQGAFNLPRPPRPPRPPPLLTASSPPSVPSLLPVSLPPPPPAATTSSVALPTAQAQSTGRSEAGGAGRAQ